MGKPGKTRGARESRGRGRDLGGPQGNQLPEGGGGRKDEGGGGVVRGRDRLYKRVGIGEGCGGVRIVGVKSPTRREKNQNWGSIIWPKVEKKEKVQNNTAEWTSSVGKKGRHEPNEEGENTEKGHKRKFSKNHPGCGRWKTRLKKKEKGQGGKTGPRGRCPNH